jgi:hypothetical protein
MKIRFVSLGLALMALFSTRPASASVSVIGWWRFGEAAAQADSSGNTNNVNFRAAFSFQPNAGQVLVAPLLSPEAVGGPLGTNTASSSRSLRFGLNATQSSFWNTTTNSPVSNYGLEIWFLGQNKGVTGGSVTWLFSTGGGQVALSGTNNVWGGEVVRVKDNFNGTSSLQAGVVVGPNSTDVLDFGPAVLMDTNSWIHLALINIGGTLGFYTNGVLVATNDTGINYPAAGAMYIGTDGDNQAIDGFIDEERLFTFGAGLFTTNDLMLRPLPAIITQPATNTTVWNGGTASFYVGAVKNPFNTYQWKVGGTTNLGGEINPRLYLPSISTGLSGGLYSCLVSNTQYTNSFTTSNALLTVVAVQTNNANAYKSAVTGEPSVVAYFPMDGSTGGTVSNVVDNTRNGLLELNAVYDSRTNRSFGERALFLNGDGDIQVPSNPAFEFAGGNGTVEALVFLTTPIVPGYIVPGNLTLFSVASTDGLSIRYKIQVTSDGSTLIYTNDTTTSVTWAIPNPLLNRFAHVAVTIDNGTNVTAYVDGVSLGGKFQSGFGSATGVPAWIGSCTSNEPSMFVGSIDDVAVYNTALSANTIAIHNSKFLFGTNTTAPAITSQPGSATLYAGGSPVLVVGVTGTPPLTYQWKTNGVNITGANSSTLTLTNTTTNNSASYTVNISNPINPAGTNSAPIVLTFVTPPAGYATRVMSDHPTTFWRLDDLAGTNMTDYSGLFSGVYLTNTTNPYTLGAAGAIVGESDTAVTFTNGSRGEVPFYAALNPNGAFTVEFWANPRAAASMGAVASQLRSGSARNGFIFYHHFNVTGWEVQMGNGGGVAIDLTSPIPVAANTWYHVAVAYDGVNTARLYVDGQLQATGSGAYVANPSAVFNIGQRNGGGAGVTWNGTLDEVAFYNYALTQSQLQSHVNIGLPLVVSVTPSANVVADSNPSVTPDDGRITGTTWQASNSDGGTTRSGVLQFTNNPQSQISLFGSGPYTNFDTAQGTYSFWMRSAGTFGGGNEAAIIFDRRPGGGAGGFVIVQEDPSGPNTGKLAVQGANNIVPNIFTTASVSDNLWHHIALVYDQTLTGFAAIYVDGTLNISNANVAAWTWTPGANLQFGRDTLYDGGYWRTYNGALDDVRIYSRALTSTEINSIYTSNSIVDASTLTLRYNFDGPSTGYNVNWTFGTLQTAPAVGGIYSNLFLSQFAPFPVAPRPGGQKYFRAQQ